MQELLPHVRGSSWRRWVRFAWIAICMLSILCAQPTLAGKGSASNDTQETTFGQGDAGYADLLRAIRDERAALQQRETNLVKEEKRLADMKADLITLLDANQLLVDELREAERKAKEAEVDLANRTSEAQLRLAKIYGGMPPEEAAARIQRMDSDLAVTLLRHMKNKATGAILGQMPVKKAAELTAALTKPTAP